MFKKLFVIHPFLFAIFPIASLYSANIHEASLADTLLPMAIMLVLTLLLLSLSMLILRDKNKAAIIVSFFLVLFFSFGHVYDKISGWQIGTFVIGRHRYLLPVWCMLLAFCAYFIIRTHRKLHNLTSILNVIASCLVVIPLISIGIYEVKTRPIWKQEYKTITENEEIDIALGNPDVLRDIYYIILDGYASSSTLQEVFNYDNHEFTDYLTEKDFYVAFESRCNFASTFLSLLSSLNMKYIDYLGKKISLKSRDRRVAIEMVRNNKVMNLLKSKGYMFVHFQTRADATEHNKYADLEFKYGYWNTEYWVVLMRTTMARPFLAPQVASEHRERTLGTFSKLAELYKINGPKFILAHIICPHPPYIFGPNGEKAVRPYHKTISEEKELYVNQLIFVNKKIKELVDEILSKSEVAPIIIFQADHGSYVLLGETTNDTWDHPTDEMLRERMRILNAYYLPDGANSLLYKSITPVNTFRLIFNYYFGANFELLDDRSYFSSYKYPYKYIDVTDKVDY